MTALVTVVVPVGPYAIYKTWLKECLESVRAQTYPADEILLIDDMAGLGDDVLEPYRGEGDSILHWGLSGMPWTEHVFLERDSESDSAKVVARIWRAPWRLGDLTAWNCGVALARNDLVFLLSCDDMLRPDCLELCVAEWEKHERKDAFYYVGAHYMGNEWPDQTCAFGNALVTKGLWRMTGGLPIEAASGAGDAAHIEILMIHFPDRLIEVAGGKPLYDYRVHDQTVTCRLGTWSEVIAATRKLTTELWKVPEWGRMS